MLYCQPVAAEQLRAAVRIGKKYHAFVELVSDGRIVVEKQLLSQAGQLHLTKIQEDFLREKRYLTVDSFEKYCDKIQKNQEGEEPFWRASGYEKSILSARTQRAGRGLKKSWRPAAALP